MGDGANQALVTFSEYTGGIVWVIHLTYQAGEKPANHVKSFDGSLRAVYNSGQVHNGHLRLRR